MRKTKMNKKDLIFYSNYCEYSKEILTILTKRDLRSKFLLICIDNGKYKIPPIITSVPTILTADFSTIYTDINISKYIDSKYPQTKHEQEIQTFSWEGNNYSESYSLLEEDNVTNTLNGGNMSSKGFTFLNDNINNVNYINSNEPPKFKDDDDVLKQSKFDISAYDSYISSRNRDEEQIKKKYHPNNYDRIL